jgi:fucose permease
MVLVASGLGYFATSLFSGRMTNEFGVGLVLTGSTGLVAVAMFGFAFAPLWYLFIACAVIHGLGSGGIDAGLNGYAAHHLSARHMNWLHACYCFGAMLGPLLMTAVLTSGWNYSAGYLVVGGLMFALWFMFLITRSHWGQAFANVPEVASSQITAAEAVRDSMVLLQVAIFFVYTGLEIALSQWAFTVLTEARGVRAAPAGMAVGMYWASIGVGRLLFGLVADRFGIDHLLRYCLLAAAAGAALFALPLNIEAALAGLILAGIGLAPVFPSLMSRTPERLGPGLSTHAVGFQVGAAMIGAAAVPAALGLIAQRNGLSAVPVGIVIVAVALWLLHERLVRYPARA